MYLTKKHKIKLTLKSSDRKHLNPHSVKIRYFDQRLETQNWLRFCDEVGQNSDVISSRLTRGFVRSPIRYYNIRFILS